MDLDAILAELLEGRGESMKGKVIGDVARVATITSLDDMDHPQYEIFTFPNHLSPHSILGLFFTGMGIAEGKESS